MQAAYMQDHVARCPNAQLAPGFAVASKAGRKDALGEMVYVVDHDAGLRNHLVVALAAENVTALAFASASAYLGFLRKDSAACVLLDTHLPDMSGLDLQRQLAEKTTPPVIFMSGVCDIATTVRAMKAGALEFLIKPVDIDALVVAARAAFVQDRRTRQRKADIAKLHHRYCQLTPREREVFPLVVGGMLNKQAASVLGISEVTLQIHRSQVMRKMEAESFAELVRMAVKLRIPHGCARTPPAVSPPAHEQAHRFHLETHTVLNSAVL